MTRYPSEAGVAGNGQWTVESVVHSASRQGSGAGCLVN